MTQLVTAIIFTVVVLQGTINAEHQDDSLACEKRNAVPTNCSTDCEIDRCPVNEQYSKVCDKQGCVQGCQCRFNEKFAANGTCIPTQQCPPFACSRPRETYAACPPYCSDACAGCPMQGPFVLLMVVECLPACRCQDGFKRKGGVCVPQDRC